jgi:hypothetical protein
MPGRVPATLLHGRLRTSTVALSVLFVAVLALYLQVRPLPAGSSSSAGGSAPVDPRSQPTTSVAATTSPTPTETSNPETTSPPASTTSTTRAGTTRSTAPASTTPGATESSARPQSTVEP